MVRKINSHVPITWNFRSSRAPSCDGYKQGSGCLGCNEKTGLKVQEEVGFGQSPGGDRGELNLDGRRVFHSAGRTREKKPYSGHAQLSP